MDCKKLAEAKAFWGNQDNDDLLFALYDYARSVERAMHDKDFDLYESSNLNCTAVMRILGDRLKGA